jgi:hypothetical protein
MCATWSVWTAVGVVSVFVEQRITCCSDLVLCCVGSQHACTVAGDGAAAYLWRAQALASYWGVRAGLMKVGGAGRVLCVHC